MDDKKPISYRKRLLKSNLIALASASILGCLWWWGTVLAVKPGGNTFLHNLVTFPIFAPEILAFFCLLFGWPTLFLKKTRGTIFVVLTCCLTYLVAVVFWSECADRAERAGLRACAERSMSLVRAIKAYQVDHGTPPANLLLLSPDYVEAFPKSGMSRYPNYGYLSGEESSSRYNGNPWALYVQLPCGGWFCETLLIYLPDEDYSHVGIFTLDEKMGHWGLIRR